MRIKEEIIGKEVVDSSGIVIGKVKDVEVDFETQIMESFIVGESGFFASFGRSRGETVVPYGMVKIIGDKLLLKNEIHENVVD
ncbi:MAG: PRC-barrel domain-containing protein [Methanobacterium paludis]|nr:PRC-barrel domain-containing protein [Methanobacterium paludis]